MGRNLITMPLQCRNGCHRYAQPANRNPFPLRSRRGKWCPIGCGPAQYQSARYLLQFDDCRHTINAIRGCERDAESGECWCGWCHWPSLYRGSHRSTGRRRSKQRADDYLRRFLKRSHGKCMGWLWSYLHTL